MKRRSWDNVVAAFNQTDLVPQPSLEDRVAELERIVALQSEYIMALEHKLNAAIASMEHTVTQR